MRLVCFLILLLIFSSVQAQSNFEFNGRKVNTDSVFYRRSFALNYYDASIDSAILSAKISTERITLIFIKSVQLTQDDDYVNAEKLLRYCIEHDWNMGMFARIKLRAFLGFVMIQKGEAYAGLELISRSEQMAIGTNDPNIILNIKIFNAEINRNFGRLEYAKYILDEGMKYTKLAYPGVSLDYMMAYATTLSQIAVDKANPDYARKAEAINDSLLNVPVLKSSPSQYGSLLAEKGASFSILKNHEQAIYYFSEAKTILQPVYPAGAFNQEINLFHEYFNTRDYKKTIDQGLFLLDEFPKFKELERRKIEVYQRLADAYEQTGEYKKAMHYTHLLIGEKDLSDERKYSKDITELEEKYKLAEKDDELEKSRIQRESIERDANLKEELLKYTIFACIVFAGLLVISILFAFQFKIARKRIVEQTMDLEAKNILLDQNVKQKDFLFKELHHRVKNNIQIIVSFMKLQSKYSSTLSVENFISEIESKLIAMALVHEKLYKGNSSESIELKEYIDEVVTYLMDSIPQLDFVPEVELSGEKVMVSIDQAIPLGLMVNEIITNSVKHAFKHVEHDQMIQIRISKSTNYFQLNIKDNGKGFPAGFNPENSKSLGGKAIVLLARQIEAKLRWQSNKGAEWEFQVPLK